MFRSKHGFWRRKGSVRLTLDSGELALLQSLGTALDELLGADEEQSGAQDPLAELVGIDESAAQPDDPALQRLFPAAYSDDDEAAADFRRFTQRGLRDLKSQRLALLTRTAAQMIADTGDDGGATRELPAAEADAWLGALNDLRLVLASRLGIERDDQEVDSDWPADDPRRGQLDVYHWLTWLQSSLLAALVA